MSKMLITGGNTGLGHETARRLKEMGHDVTIACRNEKKARPASAELGVKYLICDVTDDSSVSRCAEQFAEQEGYLDVLINNAGVPGGYTGIDNMTVDAMKRIYEVNVFGAMRMILAFLPLLQKSDNPVIVNVSSGLGSFGQIQNPDLMESRVATPLYSSSKAALSMLTLSLSKALPDIRINAADPGSTKTGENFPYGAQTVTEGTDAVVRLATIGKDGPTGTFMNRDGRIPW